MTGKVVPADRALKSTTMETRYMADEDVRSQEESCDIQLRREELQWQRRKFAYSVGAMVAAFLIFSTSWTFRLGSPFYPGNRELAFYAERLNSEVRYQRERQEMLEARLEELETGHITLRRLTDASQETIEDMQRLLNELREL